MKKKEKNLKHNNKIFEAILPFFVISVLLYFYFDNKVIGISNTITYIVLFVSLILSFIILSNKKFNFETLLNIIYLFLTLYFSIYSSLFSIIYFSKEKNDNFIYCKILKFKKYGNDGLIYSYKNMSYSNNFQDSLIYNREKKTYYFKIKGNKSIFDTFIVKSGEIVSKNTR